MLNRRCSSRLRCRGLDLPANYLCPPIPGRVDYTTNLADLLARSNGKQIPRGRKIKALDIGTRCQLGLPPHRAERLRGISTGVDIDPVALEVCANRFGRDNNLDVDLRLQARPRRMSLTV